jgi:hypothetical protein
MLNATVSLPIVAATVTAVCSFAAFCWGAYVTYDEWDIMLATERVSAFGALFVLACMLYTALCVLTS